MCSSVIGRLPSMCKAQDSVSPRYCKDFSKRNSKSEVQAYCRATLHQMVM